MRYILSLLTVSALATLLACQAASTANTNGSGNGNKVVQAESSPPKTEDKKTEDKKSHDADHAAEAEAPRINLADAKKDFDAGNVVFIDTRAEAAYKTERIKGSINMPMEGFEAKYKEIPTGKKIIAYCS